MWCKMVNLGEMAIAWPPDRARPGPLLRSGSCFTCADQRSGKRTKKDQRLPECIVARLHKTSLLHRKRQTGRRGPRCPCSRWRTSSPAKQNMGMILPQDKLVVVTWDRLGICMGGAIGDEIEILVWLLLLPSWFRKDIFSFPFRWSLYVSSRCSTISRERQVQVQQWTRQDVSGSSVASCSSPGWRGWGRRWVASSSRAWSTCRPTRSRRRSAAGPHWQDSTLAPARCSVFDNVRDVTRFSPPSWLGCSPLPPRNRSRSHLASEKSKMY